MKLKLRSRTLLLTLTALLIGLATSPVSAIPSVYNFVPIQDDFNSQGFTGSITLDVSSSSSGSIANVLAINVSGPFVGSEQFDALTQYLTLNSLTFAWTPNTITTMDLSVRDTGSDAYHFSVYHDGLYVRGMDALAYGSWVAQTPPPQTQNVPDGSNTAVLLVISLVAVMGYRHRTAIVSAARR